MTWRDIWTFGGGTVVGAAINYVFAGLATRRTEGEARTKRRKAFEACRAEMPGLIREMQVNAKTTDLRALREFVILANERIMFGHDRPRMQFYEEKHPHVRNQVAMLESEGFVTRWAGRSADETPIFRMTEELHGMLTEN